MMMLRYAGLSRVVSGAVASVAGLCVLAVFSGGCDDPEAESDSEAVAPSDERRPGAGGDDSGEGEGEAEQETAGDEHGHEHSEHEGDHGGVHLADEMVELGRRYSAIWFAGEVGNAEMVDYQIHEIEEMLAELEAASPTENGVDVAGRLRSDVVDRLDELHVATREGEREAFGETYEEVMEACESCHADTGHDFINLKEPEYNPYPNLDFAPEE